MDEGRQLDMAVEQKLTGKQKAAAILVSIGTEAASKIYKNLKEDEVEELTYEITRLQNISSDKMESILAEFRDLCLTQKVITEGGLEYAKKVLEKAFGEQQANNLLSRVSKVAEIKSFEFLRKADAKSILNMIQNEHSQTIALVLSYLQADKASIIISELHKEKRIEVVERIAKMDRASPDIIAQVEEELENKFKSVLSVDYTEIGGVNYVADIMNNMDRSNEKYIFDELNKKNMKLADEIRMKMFVFEDIAGMESYDIQKFLREVDAKDLVLAIKGTNKEVANVLFANMSTKMAETIQSELDFAHNVRVKDAEESQQRIVSIIRRLEDAGEVTLMTSGKGGIIE